jgi:hypothetical protein
VAAAIASWVRSLALFSSLTLPLAARAQECPAGTEPKDGACAPKVTIECPAGTIFEPGKGCVAKVVECPAGMILDANKCVPRPAPPGPPKEPETPVPPAAPQSPAAPKRFQVGVRAAVAFPLFNALRSATDNSDIALSKEVTLAVPIGLELGYRVIDALYVGAIVSYGFALPHEAADGYCQPSAASCTGSQLRVAFQGRFYPLRNRSFDPWVGLGFGYERLTLRYEGPVASGGTGVATTTYSGVEYFELSAGSDFELVRDLSVGPFLSFALGQYGRQSLTEETGALTFTSNDAIKNPAVHGWFQLGARGAFGLL